MSTLTCGVCKVCKFDTAEELENHEKTCDGLFKEIFTCDVCTVAHFDTLEEAIEHENRCRDEMCKPGTTAVCTRADDDALSEQSTGQHRVKVSSDHPNQSRQLSSSPCDALDAATAPSVIDQSTRQQLDQSPKQQRNTVFVTIPPGWIGLTLKLNKILGGATVTKVEANSTTGGKVDVDDRIISIDNQKIVSIADYAINHGNIRTLEVAKARAHQIIPKSLKHALFTSSLNTNKNSTSSDPLLGPHAPSAGDSSNIFTPSDIVKNSPTVHIHNYREKKQLSVNLHPVSIPFDPIDENFDYSLERELAWLIEESAIILPQLAQTSMSQPFILDFAWKHCSFELRSAIDKVFPRETSNVVKNMKVDMTEQDIREKYCLREDYVVLDADLLELVEKEKIRHLRGDIQRVVFNLGFRRSSSIERELNVILSDRFVDAVGEIATNKPPRRQRIRRKRLVNDDFIVTADEVNRTVLSAAKTINEIVAIATHVPSELSVLEDEVAFLIEESLMLLPDHMLAGSADPQKVGIITSVVSAGLSTQHDDDINWDYVCANASEQLKQVIEKKGIKRRPLRRIIRYHEVEVRIAFERRRVEICKLLILDGYRREQTRANLPSNDLLLQVGLLNVMKVRLKYRLRSCGLSSQHASKKDLRSACNIRNKKQRIHPKKKKIALDFTNVDPRRYSVLNATERELAFLREEFEMEYEHSCFDWDYIEKRSSRQLKQIMSEKKVTPLGKNPSVAGVSKLRKLVRLDSVEVNHAFTNLRRDIRYALLVGFKRDLRRSRLPDLPVAPLNRVSRGNYVIDVEYPSDMDHTVSWPTNLLSGEWKIDRDWHDDVINHPPLLPSAIAAVLGLIDETNSVKLGDSGDGNSHQPETESCRESTGDDASEDDNSAIDCALGE